MKNFHSARDFVREIGLGFSSSYRFNRQPLWRAQGDGSFSSGFGTAFLIFDVAFRVAPMMPHMYSR